jgi:hypothetical protein
VAPEADEFDVTFPTLGFLWSAWIARHCRVPDRHERGRPFVEYDYQFWCTANMGRVRPGVKHDPDRPLLNQAFFYRQHQIIGPQKIGKGPWTACHIARAAVGPTEFAGWAQEGDQYLCEDHGCPCGWIYDYLPGEPMGRRNPSPLVQIAASSEEQVGNIWRPLISMIALGPLKELLLPRGEFVRIVGDTGNSDLDRIDRVTAAAQSRLGAPTSEVFLDETGTFTNPKLIEMGDTMRRGVAGMGGRSSETTNQYDPSQRSYARETFESTEPDTFKYWRDPRTLRHKDGTALSFKVARDRRKILAYVYAGASHVNLDSIDAECVKLLAKDPAQAMRFFGNMPEQGQGTWMPHELWEAAYERAAVAS